MIANTVHYVIYNGIQLNLSRIESFESTNVYDENEVDRTFNHVRVRVSGILNATVNLDGLGNANLLTYLRRALMEPRKDLTIAFNGVPTINTNGPDANNGPNPINVRVYQLNVATIYVDYEIEMWEAACASSQTIVTSNRWTQTTDIDEDGYTTLTSSGVLTINANQTAGNADYYRGIPYPVNIKPIGFMRASQNFTVSSDGTELIWTVVDKEVLLPGPQYKDDANTLRPITRWEGSWSEGATKDLGGTILEANLSVRAWGQKDTPKNTLLDFCMKVLQSRRIGLSYPMKEYSIREELNDNSVAIDVSFYTTNPLNFVSFLGLKNGLQYTSSFGAKLDIYDPDTPTVAISDRGTAGLWLVVKDIVSTCDSKTTSTVKTSQPSANQTPSSQGTLPAPATKTLQTSRNDVKQDSYPYVVSRVECRTIGNQGIIQLPQASGDAGTPSFVAQMNSPVSKQVVRFEYQRLNAAPQLPKPETAGGTLVSWNLDRPDPMILASGVDRVYTVRGQYVFVITNPVQLAYTPIVMPHQITDNVPLSDQPQNVIASANFVTGIIA